VHQSQCRSIEQRLGGSSVAEICGPAAGDAERRGEPYDGLRDLNLAAYAAWDKSAAAARDQLSG